MVVIEPDILSCETVSCQ